MGTEEDAPRLKASRDQLLRMFGHHRSVTEPGTPEKQIGSERTDGEFTTELESLEKEVPELFPNL
ncbi:hypothetical protein [Halorussus marinus]|uniref:hypothetical protein n=1 Tax=Halorussus marinus TaxID=2505976 RepID=UPI00106EDCDB|nr:hypothetical protein [Halorussus marinus]